MELGQCQLYYFTTRPDIILHLYKFIPSIFPESEVEIFIFTSSTAQGGGGSFKNRKPIGEVGCCESGMAERSHWWTERCLISLSSSLFLYLSLIIYLPTYWSICLSIYLSVCLSVYLSPYLSIYLSSWLRARRFSEPTFRPSGATNHWKTQCFATSYLFAHLHLLSSDSFSSTLLSSNLSLLSASALLCFSSVHIAGSLTSKLPLQCSVI